VDILEVGHRLASPYGAVLPAGFGTDGIKVERPVGTVQPAL
jgi:hypothetical protein